MRFNDGQLANGRVGALRFTRLRSCFNQTSSCKRALGTFATRLQSKRTHGDKVFNRRHPGTRGCLFRDIAVRNAKVEYCTYGLRKMCYGHMQYSGQPQKPWHEQLARTAAKTDNLRRELYIRADRGCEGTSQVRNAIAPRRHGSHI